MKIVTIEISQHEASDLTDRLFVKLGLPLERERRDEELAEFLTDTVNRLPTLAAKRRASRSRVDANIEFPHYRVTKPFVPAFTEEWGRGGRGEKVMRSRWEKDPAQDVDPNCLCIEAKIRASIVEHVLHAEVHFSISVEERHPAPEGVPFLYIQEPASRYERVRLTIQVPASPRAVEHRKMRQATFEAARDASRKLSVLAIEANGLDRMFSYEEGVAVFGREQMAGLTIERGKPGDWLEIRQRAIEPQGNYSVCLYRPDGRGGLVRIAVEEINYFASFG